MTCIVRGCLPDRALFEAGRHPRRPLQPGRPRADVWSGMPGRTPAIALVAAFALVAPAAAQAPQPTVLVVGDSLAVGMKPYLTTLLQPNAVVWDARTGRTT